MIWRLLNTCRFHIFVGLTNCNVYIITVPTPLDEAKQPDLNPLKSASEMVGKVLSQGDIVI